MDGLIFFSPLEFTNTHCPFPTKKLLLSDEGFWKPDLFKIKPLVANKKAAIANSAKAGVDPEQSIDLIGNSRGTKNVLEVGLQLLQF